MTGRSKCSTGLRALLAAALIAALAIALAACGGDDEEPTTTTGAAGTPAAGAGETAAAGEAALMGPPPVKEKVGDAVKRLEGALESGDCDKINELNPLGRPLISTEQRCELLKRLKGLKVKDTAEFGKLGGVIALERGVGTLNLILVRDSDGLLHLAYLDAFTGESGTEGKLAKQFKEVAAKGTKALAEGDCEAFLKVAYRRFGLANGTDREACDRAESNIVSALLERGGEPKPVDLAGGSQYAFFGIDTPVSYLTVIAARQTEEGLAPGLPKEVRELPKGAPEYGIVDVLRTNPRQPIEAPEESPDSG